MAQPGPQSGPQPGPPASEYKVGWISALPVELTTAVAMLDRTYIGQTDTAQYTLGSVYNHNVVLACLPAGQIGTNAAATVVADMKSKFINLTIGLMVGIGAGVPSTGSDIRLGDVVISQPQRCYGGVVQYDFGKTGPGYSSTEGFLNSPPKILLTAVAKVRSNLSLDVSRIPEHLTSIVQHEEFNRIHAGPDILYRADYQHTGDLTCDNCNKTMIVTRTPRVRDEVVIHYGTIASGNQVMKDGITRDALSAKLGGVLCFEMEAAGLMNYLPSLVVRGICDYADSHKNKKWQPFAAAAAAACAKEVLRCVPVDPHPFSYLILNVRKMDDIDLKIYARSALTPEERQHYLENLKFDQIDARHATIKTAYPYTCRWLLNRSEYRNWLKIERNPEHGGFLWIKGKPGSGKSTIMKFAYADAKQKLAGTTVLSFFFNARGSELEKTTIGMYRSLLCQFLGEHRELQIVLDPLASWNTMSYPNEIETIKNLFRQAMEHFGRRSLTCFIDALDECNEDQVREMIAFWEQLGELQAHNQGIFRVCFSSRHYPHITIRRGIELVLEGQEEHQHDIACYLQNELRIGDGPVVKQIKADILKRASGVFLWVALVVTILNKEYDRGRIHALLKRLNEIPNGLNELFRDILLKDGESIEELIICIQWILFARRPLSREELYFAVLTGAEPDQMDDWHPEEYTAHDMERYILSASKGLAEFTKSDRPTAQFIHESVRDYLLSGNGLEWLRSDLVRNFPGLSHERLKMFCYHNIQMFLSEYRTWVHTLPLPTTGKYVLLRYALKHVLYHADAAGGYGVLQTQFFAGFPFRLWDQLNKSFLKEGYSNEDYSRHASQLYVLAVQDLPNLVRVELEGVPHMDILGEFFKYPLFAAISLGKAKVVTALLMPTQKSCPISDISAPQFGVVVNRVIRNSNGYHLTTDRTLFLQACSRGDLPLAKVLLATGKVDPNCRNKYGQTVLSCAAEQGQKEIVRLLLALHRSHSLDKSLPNTMPVVELNATDIYSRTALFWAVLSGNETLVKLMIDCPEVKFDCKDKDGRTPLHLAVAWGYTGMVSTLLAQRQGEVDVKDNLGQTPLALAAKKGNVAAVQLLMAHPFVSVNSQDDIGRTPLCIAVKEGHDAVIKVLLECRGVESGIKDAFGRLPLWYSKKSEVTELLSKHLSTVYLETESEHHIHD